MIKKGNGSKSLKYETVHLETDYAITLNIPDLKGSIRLDHHTYIMLLRKKFAPIPGLSYRLYPEYSQTGRLHYHGIVRFNTIIAKNYWYEMIYKLDCNFKFDTIADPETWDTYITKQYEHMKPFFDKLKLDYELSPKNIKVILDKNTKPKTFEEYIDNCKTSD